MSASPEGQPRRRARAALRSALGLAIGLGLLPLATDHAHAAPPKHAKPAHPATSTSPADRSAASGKVVARVGPLAVDADEVDARAADLQRSYEEKTGLKLTTAMRQSICRQALETLVRARLFQLESARLADAVPDAEAEAFVKRTPVFNPGGQFSQHAYDNARHNDPAKFQMVLREVKRQIAAEKFARDMRLKGTPADADLERAARRELDAVDVDAFLIPSGTFTGRHREPSEREVIEAYHQHAREEEQPAHATVLAIAIEHDPHTSDPGDVKERAARAIAALQQGTDPAQVSDQVSGTRKRLELREDNYPGSWHATPAQNEAIYHAAPRTVMTEPVAAAHGVYVVMVEDAAPRHQASLAEAAPQLREFLREQIRSRDDERELHALYDASRDSLGRPGYKLRVATIERAKLAIPAPTAADLQAFYQAHLADYTHYDAASGGLQSTPLAQVHDDLVKRFGESRRDLVARDLANRISDAWNRGQQDAGAEHQAVVKDLGVVPYGSRYDVGPASAAVSDSLRRRLYDKRIEIVPFEGGYAVAQAYQLVEQVVPTFDQVAGTLLDRLHAQQEDAEIARARTLYERDPSRYLTGRMIYYSRMWLRQPEIIDVPLTHEEVESWYRTHLAQYASPEKFRVRQILVQVPPDDAGADARARERAAAIVKRARGGEDFGDLARKESDDDHTREDGGDLSWRSRGELDPALENAAFRLKVGQVSDPVRTPDGYHILQVTDHVAEQAEPLAWVYTTVGTDAAVDKAGRLSRRMADSLYQTIRSPAQARAVAARLGLEIEEFHHVPGDRQMPEERIPMAERLERLKPGEMYPGIEYFVGQGAAVMWVDSIAAPHLPIWTQAEGPVLEEYRRRMGQAALQAKQAEMDSLFHAGWSFDSLAALWGGADHEGKLVRRQGLKGFGDPAVIDSLVFGDRGAPPLQVGQVSGWFDIGGAVGRLRLNGRHEPSAEEIQRRIAEDRGLVQEYRLQDELKSMRQRYPVTILDPTLREATLPPLPPMPEL